MRTSLIDVPHVQLIPAVESRGQGDCQLRSRGSIQSEGLTIPRLHSKKLFLSCLHSSGSSSWWFLRHSLGVRGGSERRTQSVRRRHSARLLRRFWQDCEGRGRWSAGLVELWEEWLTMAGNGEEIGSGEERAAPFSTPRPFACEQLDGGGVFHQKRHPPGLSATLSDLLLI